MKNVTPNQKILRIVLSVWLVRVIYAMLFTAIPVYALSTGISTPAIGVALAFVGYATFITNLYCAVYVERMNNIVLMRLSLVGLLAVCVAIPMMTTSSLWPYTLVFVILGIALGTFRAMSGALVTHLVGRDRLATTLGKFNSSYVFGAAIGPLLATTIAQQHSNFAVFIFGSILAAIGLACVMQISSEPIAQPPFGASSPTLIEHLRRMRELVIARHLFWPMCFAMVDIFVLRTWILFFPIFAGEQGTQKIPLVTVGALITFESALYIASQPLWGKVIDKLGLKLPLMIGLSAPAVVAIVPTVDSTLALFLVLGLCGLLNGAAYPAYTKMALERAQDNEKARAMVLISTSSDCATFLGPLFGAAIASASGSAAHVFFALAPICLVTAVLSTKAR